MNMEEGPHRIARLLRLPTKQLGSSRTGSSPVEDGSCIPKNTICMYCFFKNGGAW